MKDLCGCKETDVLLKIHIQVPVVLLQSATDHHSVDAL